jgi:hypothetical protein
MLHIVHLIQRRRGQRPLAIALPPIVMSALALAAGLFLLAGR